MLSRLFVVAALIASAVALSACTNTVKGVGRDVHNDAQATAKAVRGR